MLQVSKCEKNAYELMYVDQNTVPRCISATSYAIFATTEGEPVCEHLRFIFRATSAWSFDFKTL